MGGGASKSPQKSVTSIYEFEKAIGKGSFATVYESKLLEEGRKNARGREIPKRVAIKAIDKSELPENEKELLEDECKIMEKLHHPNCVSLLEFFDEPDYFYLVLELAEGGELFNRIVEKGYYNEVEAAHAIKQVAQGLAYLESQGVVHRDIKPENLIYEGSDDCSSIKLTDFGLAKDVSGCKDEFPLIDPCGTPGYVAPEILKGRPYGYKVDTWAVGVILFILLCGYPPFYAEEQHDLFEQIKRGEYKFESPYWDDVSDAAKTVITKLLQVDPHKRLSAKQLLLEPWVADPEAQSKSNLGEHVVQGIDKLRKEKLQRAFFKVRAMTRFETLAKAAKSFSSRGDVEESEANQEAEGIQNDNKQVDVDSTSKDPESDQDKQKASSDDAEPSQEKNNAQEENSSAQAENPAQEEEQGEEEATV